MHANPADIVRNVAELIRPPRRISVSAAAEQYLKLNEPGGYCGDFDLGVAPYMREPMDLKASRRFEGVVFVGPARSLKTQALIDRGIADGSFRAGLDAVDLHMTISALAFYFVSNRHSFHAIFGVDMTSEAAAERRRAQVIDNVLRYCRADA